MTQLKARGPKTKIKELRIELYDRVNALGIGAQGLGGLSTEVVWSWKEGDRLLLSGTLLTGRDAAHLVSNASRAAWVVAFADLGMEAIDEFEVDAMPVTVRRLPVLA